MAGRRYRGQALASGVNLLSQFLLNRMEERRQAQRDAQTFKQDLVKEVIKQRIASLDTVAKEQRALERSKTLEQLKHDLRRQDGFTPEKEKQFTRAQGQAMEGLQQMPGDIRALAEQNAATRPPVSRMAGMLNPGMARAAALPGLTDRQQQMLASMIQNRQRQLAAANRGLAGGGVATDTEDSMPSFDSEDEALNAGLPSGTLVLIQGREARID